MGSRIMHAIIGYKVMANLHIEDNYSFLVGSIAPDAVFESELKAASHFFVGNEADFSRSVDYEGFLKKYDFYLPQHQDYLLGYYTHLIADDIWLRGFYLPWLRNRMQAEHQIHSMYHRDFQLLNSKLLHHYELSDHLQSLFELNKVIPNLDEVPFERVKEFIPFVVNDMTDSLSSLTEELQVFTFEQIIGYVETSVEVATLRIKLQSEKISSSC
ncbi:hydrolase [Priestia koreensis]|uniref:hydrolase n=1 Tax=Priestia koreensis TaxID=284581 RepID=UPI001F59D834|nr:hydrolase [Priestia koreensis]UNL86977.1 hydrolase [Priestia koreensis]